MILVQLREQVQYEYEDQMNNATFIIELDQIIYQFDDTKVRDLTFKDTIDGTLQFYQSTSI